MDYYVYIILCEDDSYYTGHALDVWSRFNQHLRGTGARYTKIHKPQKLVYVERFSSRGEAIGREREIKRLSRSEKKRLVKSSSRQAKKVKVNRVGRAVDRCSPTHDD